MAKPRGLRFDEHGPSLDGVPLTRRTRKGWQPTEQQILERELVNLAGLVAADLVGRLDAVCRAMNMGDFATAAIAAEHATRNIKRKPPGPLAKASPDDPKHPGWPAGSPDGKGGPFMPKDDTLPESKDAKIGRLAARRGIRAILRRILTFKRVAWIAGEILGDAVPGVDAVSSTATLVDAVKLAGDAAVDVADTEAAVAFVEKGPQALEDLRVSQPTERFSSYAAFKKSDLEKRFGPAGDGYEYHHIVEQGPNAATLTPQDLNSTENIIRIPRLLHEDVTRYFARKGTADEIEMPLRQFLRGKPYSVQRKWGLKALQNVGALK